MSQVLLFLGVVALVSALIEFIINIVEELKNNRRRKRIREIKSSSSSSFSESTNELNRLHEELLESKRKISYREPAVLILLLASATFFLLQLAVNS